jgi:phosphocarrier protein
MVRKEITIANKLGMHARAAAKFVSLASSFSSHIELEKGHRKVNGKSIMGVMMLAASKGTTITLYTDGSDESEAADRLVQLINDRFGENE